MGFIRTHTQNINNAWLHLKSFHKYAHTWAPEDALFGGAIIHLPLNYQTVTVIDWMKQSAHVLSLHSLSDSEGALKL